MAMSDHNQSLGQMFADLSRETATLIQKEIELATTELTEKASRMSRSASLVVVGGMIAYSGLLAVVAAIILGLVEYGVSAWAAALLTGVFVVGVGYLLVHRGISALRSQDMRLRETIETLKEDAQWLSSQVR
jgi:uncharacterized membrane protein YqjE